jgi:hypothetical protein
MYEYLEATGLRGDGEGQMGNKFTVKRSLVRDVVDEQNSHGTPVVCNSNGTEPFLTSSVPLVREFR